MRRLFVLAALAVSALSFAKWARPNLDVPIARLIKNVEAKLKANPKDAEAAYHLGRLHSMAFAESKGNVELYGTEKDFRYPHWSTVKVTRASTNPKLMKDELTHLKKSLDFYLTASKLDDKNGLYRLGYAWMLEQAAPFASQIGAMSHGSFPMRTGDYVRLALAHYRNLYESFLDKDLKAQGHIMGVQDVYVSEDAGAGIIRLSPKLPSREKAEILANIKKLEKKAVGITPIVFPLDRVSTFGALLSPRTQVSFDLAGDGHTRNWSWVGSNTGILVWDPRGTGQVTSGRQLFGSSTFWLFYNNGYEALAALDNSGDGWLTGRELAGIAVWTDLNGNGKSEKGEVRPVSDWNVTGISTRASGRSSVLWASEGIRFGDGGTCPTYDWEPTSIRR